MSTTINEARKVDKMMYQHAAWRHAQEMLNAVKTIVSDRALTLVRVMEVGGYEEDITRARIDLRKALDLMDLRSKELQEAEDIFAAGQ